MINFENLLQLLEKLKTEQDYITYFVKVRWNGEIKCPFCSHNKVYSFQDKKRFKCKSCSNIFSYKTGIIFENTKIPMRKWFLAIYIQASHKKRDIKPSTSKRFRNYTKDGLVYALKN